MAENITLDELKNDAIPAAKETEATEKPAILFLLSNAGNGNVFIISNRLNIAIQIIVRNRATKNLHNIPYSWNIVTIIAHKSS